jgi:serine/threonine protein kinase
VWEFRDVICSLVDSCACIHDGIGKTVAYFPIEVREIDGEEKVLMGLVQELGDATLFDRITDMHERHRRLHNAHIQKRVATDVYVEKTKVFLKEVWETADHLIDTVATLAANNIIHRDLKPMNIVRCNGVLKVIDFGEARQLPETSAYLTFDRGTRVYLPPGGRGLNHDTYSLACSIYEMLAGPYEFLVEPVSRTEDAMRKKFRQVFGDENRLEHMIDGFAKVLSIMVQTPEGEEVSVNAAVAKEMIAGMQGLFND